MQIIFGTTFTLHSRVQETHHRGIPIIVTARVSRAFSHRCPWIVYKAFTGVPRTWSQAPPGRMGLCLEYIIPLRVRCKLTETQHHETPYLG
jgi:hypothetical protein